MITYDVIKQTAKENGVRITDLCALAPKNDPFYTGRPAELTAAHWFTDLWQGFGFATGVHLRRMHYRIVSQKTAVSRPDGTPYQNTQRDWDYLSEASKWARYLNLVSPGAFVDRRNPEAIIHARWSQPDDYFYEDPTPRYTIENEWNSDHFYLPQLPQLDDLPYELPDLPEFQVQGYNAIEQEYHLECWVEKTTMNDVLVTLAQRYQVNLITGAGEMSITSVVEFLQRVRQADRPARIIYISDFDPAGLGMPISVARKVEYFQRNEGFGQLDIRLQPIALTADQVAQFNLPRVPVKDSDLRKANFEAAYGTGQVELDALEALYPGQLAQQVEQAILHYYDPELPFRARTVRRRLINDLDQERSEALAPFQAELDDLDSDYSQLLGDYTATQGEFETLIEQFQPHLDQYSSRLTDLQQRSQALYSNIADRLQGIDLDLDEYALPDPELPEESDALLYDSRRDYLAQLSAYKAHRHGLNGKTG